MTSPSPDKYFREKHKSISRLDCKKIENHDMYNTRYVQRKAALLVYTPVSRTRLIFCTHACVFSPQNMAGSQDYNQPPHHRDYSEVEKCECNACSQTSKTTFTSSECILYQYIATMHVVTYRGQHCMANGVLSLC